MLTPRWWLEGRYFCRDEGQKWGRTKRTTPGEGQESNKSSDFLFWKQAHKDPRTETERQMGATTATASRAAAQGDKSRFSFKREGKKQPLVQGLLLDGSQSGDRSRWTLLIGPLVSRRQVWWGSINASWDLVAFSLISYRSPPIETALGLHSSVADSRSVSPTLRC